MRFELRGIHEGELVTLVWDNGELAGARSALIEAERNVAAGEYVPLTPTGPAWRADLKNPARAYVTLLSVLNPARGITVSGELPDIPVYELPDGAVG